MKNRNTLIALAIGALGFAGAAAAQVTDGVLIRGITLPGAGVAGQSTGVMCDFSGETVDGNGLLEDASVQCRAGGTADNTVGGLPARFNAYCVTQNKGSGARVLSAPVTKPPPPNPNHCLMSGIKPKAATQRFGAAVWR